MGKKLDHGELVGLAASFQAIPEYRKNLLNIEHKLADIIAISVCGVIAGAEGPSDIFDWAEVHQEKLTKILQLEHGIPSRDTIRRTLEAIKPEVFQKCFLEWLNGFRENNSFEKEHIGNARALHPGSTLPRRRDNPLALLADANS